jgi:hypothetical protein
MSKNTPAAVDAAPHRINPRSVAPDAKLLSTPDTILWGYIAANLPPALTIKPGQIVEIEALSHQGLTSNRDPESFFAGYGIPAQDVLPDAKAVFAEVKRPKGASVHILTGPVYIEGARNPETQRYSPMISRFHSIHLWALWRYPHPPVWHGVVYAAGRLGRQYGSEIHGHRLVAFICRSSTKARSSLPVTATPSRVTAKWTAGRLKSRSSQRCNSFYTRARALNRRGLRR